MAQVSILKVNYGGWPNCYRVSDGTIEFIATTDVGPRIIRFGFVGGPNEFCEFTEQMGKIGGDEWRIYGGHRLWHSPESRARSYYPDNRPIHIEEIEGGIRLRQYTEPTTHIAKCIEIVFAGENAEVDGSGGQVIVTHKMTNDGVWPVELAAWGLSVMAPGGVGIAPQTTEADPEGLLPNRWLVVWPYTDLTDSRLYLGKRFIFLRQDSSAAQPCKIGASVTDGWAAYANKGHLFVKSFEYMDEALYPDGGASVEMYANDRMLELETLSPMVLLDPGDTVEHVEVWSLHKDISLPDDSRSITEEIVQSTILPVVEGR
ncbi:MAG TPA: hypothetical protein GX509_07530 [Firmicutes bacterium]|nr:hypothetical protein [Bacillota bacterium]